MFLNAGLMRLGLALAVAGVAGCARARVPAVEITPRSAWAAAEPLMDRLVPHAPKRLTIHHAGVQDDGSVPGDEKMRRLYRFSVKDKPWGDVPYHYVIDRQGHVFEGRALGFAPDTNTGYDVIGHVGICVNGDLTVQPLEEAQYRALVDLVVVVSAKLRIPDDRIAGHMDYSAGKTTCPGALEHYLRDGTLLKHLQAVRRGRSFVFERKPYEPKRLEGSRGASHSGWHGSTKWTRGAARRRSDARVRCGGPMPPSKLPPNLGCIPA